MYWRMFLSRSGSDHGLDFWDDRSFFYLSFYFFFLRRLILHDDRSFGDFQNITRRKGSAFAEKVAGKNPFQSEVLGIKLNIAALSEHDTALRLNDLSDDRPFIFQKR